MYGGELTESDFPERRAYIDQPFRFDVDFGLNELPEEPGLFVIRGARLSRRFFLVSSGYSRDTARRDLLYAIRDHLVSRRDHQPFFDARGSRVLSLSLQEIARLFLLDDFFSGHLCK